MRSSNKSRNRNKNSNRRGSVGNNINRVFESAGPEGRVRGTPQQIIDKYTSLTYDAQLSGDRVAAENFQQHAEHYSRLLIEAQKEIAEKQTEQQAANGNNKTVGQVSENENHQNDKKYSEDPDIKDGKIVEFGKTVEKVTPDSLDDVQVKRSNKRKVLDRNGKKRDRENTKTIEI